MPACGPEGYSVIYIKINKWCIEKFLKAQSSLQMLNGKCKFITHLILPQFSPQIERVPLSPFCVQLFPYLFHLFSRDALRSTGDKSLMDACLDFVWQCFIPLFLLKVLHLIPEVFFQLLCHCWSSWCGVCWYILVRLAVFYGQLFLLSCWTSLHQGQQHLEEGGPAAGDRNPPSHPRLWSGIPASPRLRHRVQDWRDIPCSCIRLRKAMETD